ncbi:MAG: hypothetical protein ABI707_15425 [Ferruginibacter sp.]
MGAVNGVINLININAYKFKHYKHLPDSDSLTNNIIDCIYEDVENNLRTGTAGRGFNKFNSVTKLFTHYDISASIKNKTNGDYAQTICEDAEKNMWVAAYGGGLNLFDRKTNRF